MSRRRREGHAQRQTADPASRADAALVFAGLLLLQPPERGHRGLVALPLHLLQQIRVLVPKCGRP